MHRPASKQTTIDGEYGDSEVVRGVDRDASVEARDAYPLDWTCHQLSVTLKEHGEYGNISETFPFEWLQSSDVAAAAGTVQETAAVLRTAHNYIEVAADRHRQHLVVVAPQHVL